MSSTDNSESNDEVPIRHGQNTTYLASVGYRSSGRQCNRDDGECDGVFWYDSHELVCSVCGYVVDMEEKRRRTSINSKSISESWSDFWSNRDESNRGESNQDEYHDSGIRKCVGGYLGPYDWVSSDDVDGTVSGLDATEFYR